MNNSIQFHPQVGRFVTPKEVKVLTATEHDDIARSLAMSAEGCRDGSEAEKLYLNMAIDHARLGRALREL